MGRISACLKIIKLFVCFVRMQLNFALGRPLHLGLTGGGGVRWVYGFRVENCFILKRGLELNCSWARCCTATLS